MMVEVTINKKEDQIERVGKRNQEEESNDVEE